jgi:thiamine biosynthesis lipoprotein
MGTTYSVAVTRLPRGVSRTSVQAVIDEVLSETNTHLSTYDASSEISAFNRAASTDEVAVSQALHDVVAIAADVSRSTGGAFDITVGPLARAWGFGDAPAVEAPPPDAGDIATLREDVGYEKLHLAADRSALRKTRPGLRLDVSGIAPGYAVDRIAERFDELGLHHYLIELGGEVRAHGRNPTGRPWRIAVEVPLAGERRPFALVELDGLGASTSGDYRDFRVVDGRRLSHTIDPRTGAPVTHRLASVCVVHPSVAHADAYATALMVLGPEKGLVLARRLGLAALFIVRAGDDGRLEERATPEFERLRRPLT